MDFSKNKGPEANTERPRNESGVYRHTESGVERIVVNDPLHGSAADAYVRLGFSRVGDVPASYYEEEAKRVAQASKSAAPTHDALAGIEARIKLLEQENSELKAAAASDKNPAEDETPTQVTEAPEVSESQEEVNEVEQTEDATPETDLRAMTLDELYSVAADEKVRGYSLYKSTDKLVDAIEKTRSEKGNE